MIRVAGAIALLFVIPAAKARGAEVTLSFSGTIKSVVDANAYGLPPIDFTPIPAGSSFSGTYTYDSNSPPTDGGTGYTRYLDLLSSGGSVTINDIQFASTDGGAAIIASEEAGFTYSGIAISTQPISLPAGWSVQVSSFPYFTVRFEDATPQARSLALPSSAADFPLAKMVLVVDFQQPVTIDGQKYGGRVYINGEITSLDVTGSPLPPVEVAIDVDPSSAKNKVNLNTKNPKPLEVAVFGAADFDVVTVVPVTIGLGDPVLTDPDTGTGQKVAPSAFDYEDVDGDGEMDLLLTFDLLSLQESGAIDWSSTSLEFKAMLDNLGAVFGSDSISIPGSNGKGKK